MTICISGCSMIDDFCYWYDGYAIRSFVNELGLGLPERSITYNDVVSCLGYPVEIRNVDDSSAILVYDGIEFLFVCLDEPIDRNINNWSLFTISVYDSKYRFDHDIAVGCSRKKIIKEFKRAKPIIECEKGEGYTDKGYIYEYYFEYQEDVVTSISCSSGVFHR